MSWVPLAPSAVMPNLPRKSAATERRRGGLRASCAALAYTSRMTSFWDFDFRDEFLGRALAQNAAGPASVPTNEPFSG